MAAQKAPRRRLERADIAVGCSRVVVDAAAVTQVEGDEPMIVGHEDRVGALGHRRLDAADVGLCRDPGLAAEVAEDRRHAVGEPGDDALAGRDRHDGEPGADERHAHGVVGHGPDGDAAQAEASDLAQTELERLESRDEAVDVLRREARHPVTVRSICRPSSSGTGLSFSKAAVSATAAPSASLASPTDAPVAMSVADHSRAPGA